MANNISYRTWKWYEFSEKMWFFDKIKNELEMSKLASVIHLSDAFILWGVEFDWLVLIGNIFYILNFKNRSGDVKWKNEWNWENDWNIMYNDKNPIEQCEQQQVILDQFLDCNADNTYFIKSIICFPFDARLDDNLVSYNENWIYICTIDKIWDILNSEDSDELIDEEVLERMWLSKQVTTFQEWVKDPARDSEFEDALSVPSAGHQIVQAWPWTWKTHFLIHKIVDKLIDLKKKNSGKWIIAITFSKTAAESLEERITKEITQKYNSLFELKDIIWKVWTIHSFCNEMLRKLNYFAYLWYSKGPVIIDDYKLSQIIESLWYDKKIIWMIWIVINKDDWDLSKFKEEETYFLWEEYECSWKIIHESLHKIRDFLIKNDYLTHDFSLMFTYEMLKNKEFFEKFKQLWYTHILVDEFQDVSHIQFEIVKALQLHTTMVWDEHQAIYWFRWASNKSFQWGEEEFKNIKKKYLTYNSRSGTKLVDKINLFLDNYKQLPEGIDVDKYKLKPFNKYDWEFSIELFDSTYNLDQAIVDKIENLVFEEKVKPNEIAILSRSKIHDETRNIANLLRDKWIICNYKSDVLIQDPFVREIFNFLDLVFNPTHIDMRQISWLEKRLYGHERITKSVNWNEVKSAQDLIKYITEKDLDPEKKLLKLLDWVISDIRDMTLSNLLLSYYKGIFLENLNFNEKINLWHYQLIISKLFTINEDIAKWDFSVFSEEVQYTEFVENNKTWVQCMSIHWAKWLQWEYVFLLWMYKWVYPSPRAELVDELNVWYVWISRAKKSLFIPYTKLNKKFNTCELSNEIAILSDNVESTTNDSMKIHLNPGDVEFDWWYLYVYWNENWIRKFQILDENTEKVIKTQMEIFWNESIESILSEDSVKNHVLEIKVDYEKENKNLREENKRIKEELSDKIISQQNKISELINKLSENEKLLIDAEKQVEIAEKEREESELKYENAVKELEDAKNNWNDELISKAEEKLKSAEKKKREAEKIASNRAKVILDLQLKIDGMWKEMDDLKNWSDKVKAEAEAQIKQANAQKEDAEKKYNTAIKELEEAKSNWNTELIAEAEEKLKNAENVMHELEDELENKNKRIQDLEEKVKELQEQQEKNKENAEWKWNYGHIFKAWQKEEIWEFVTKKINKANRSVMLIEPYIDSKTFELMSHRRIWVKWIIAYEKRKTLYSGEINWNQNVLSELLGHKNDQEWNPIVVRTLANLHDRFMIIDDVVYQIWTSLNSTLWEKATTIQKLRNTKEEILDAHRE